MVKIITKGGMRLHQCEECGFYYKEKEFAQKCEAWCAKHKSCNIEITRNAVRM